MIYCVKIQLCYTLNGMTKRINIAVTDEMFERLQSVKHLINVSGVCQGEIEQAVKLMEIKMETLQSRDKIVARLRIESQQTAEMWFKQGKAAGLEHSEGLGFQDFKAIEQIYENRPNLERDGFWLDWRALDDGLGNLGAADWMRDHLDDLSPKPHDTERDYLAGWIEGVMDVWNDVKGEI
jgi:hypothetical protein